MNLPYSSAVPINLLASCFNSTSATYKFYWLLAILDAAEEGKMEVSKKELFARMLSTSWYTVNYFNISFGFQDLIQKAVQEIKELEDIRIDADRSLIFQKLSNPTSAKTEVLLKHFDKNVPHWFLSPWYPGRNRQDIYTLSQENSHSPLYALYRDKIIINSDWVEYLQKNSRIIRDFIYWNLAMFLQIRNPNVPDIPNKLIKPATRSTLLNQRKFWDIILDEVGSLECIYTGKKLTKGNYHVEHFVPYSFVSHNQIWNLIPGDSCFNLSKSNKLPAMDKYFEGFFNLQKLALDIYLDKKPQEKLLQEYFYIDKNFAEGIDRDKFFQVINPLITIASNNGFNFYSEKPC